MTPDFVPDPARAEADLQRTRRPMPSEEELSILAALSAVLRARRAVLACALAGALVAVGVALARHRTFTSHSSFVPQAQRLSQGLGGLAAQLGFNLPNLEGAQGPSFYGDLLQTKTILGEVVDTSYTAPRLAPGGTVRLADVYRVDPDDPPAVRRVEAIKRLEKNLDVDVNSATNVVTLEVRSRDPELSRQINQRLLLLLNQFNQETRQSRAAAEREFTERRRSEVRADLRAAEDRLQKFLQSNRDYSHSPQLVFERDRLSREISQQSQLYSTVSQAYEQAKIEEVRDTPVITILEAPDLAAKPDSRRLIRNLLLGLVLGGMVGMVVAFVRFFGEQLQARNAPEYAAFSALGRATVRDLTRPMWLLSRRRPDDR
jgi:uncharacterized protein involved in exopolysaccharide biosynthesis